MPRGQPAAPKALMAAIVVALVLGLTGVVFLGLMLRERTAAAGSASAGGLTLKLQSAQWIEMEHGQGGGFAMPQQMTPGAPAADQERLALGVTVENRGGSARQFSRSEFAIEGPNGQTWPLVTENLDSKYLPPGVGVTGSLSFDLPAANASQGNPTLFLVWHRAGKVVRLPVTVGAASHTHH